MKSIYSNYFIPGFIPFFSTAIPVAIIVLSNDVKALIQSQTSYISILILAPMIIGIIPSIDAIKKHLAALRAKEFLGFHLYDETVNKLEQKLNRKIAIIKKHFSGNIHFTIMMPDNPRKKTFLKVIAGSKFVKNTPTMNREFKWNEGVAGKIWALGKTSVPISLSEAWPESFLKYNLKSPKNNFNQSFRYHKSKCGVAVPIWINETDGFYITKTRFKVIGVMNFGSDSEDDFNYLDSNDFKDSLLYFANNDFKKEILIMLELSK